MCRSAPGLSSSAAVEVAFAALWQELGGWPARRMDLAQLCQHAENAYVGVNCGLMDQFASANGVEGHALYFDTRSLDLHPVPLPAGTRDRDRRFGRAPQPDHLGL